MNKRFIKLIEDILNDLPEREMLIVKERAFTNRTWTDIGVYFGITGGRVKQVYIKALEHIIIHKKLYEDF